MGVLCAEAMMGEERMELSEFFDINRERGTDFYETVLLLEMEETRKSEAEMHTHMENMWNVMENSAKKGISEPISSRSGMTGCEGYTLYRKAKGEYTRAAAIAMGVANINSAMGKIVAAPTAGACGILPGVLVTLQERMDCDREQMVKALFIAGFLGKYIAEKASVSGARHGCQAECGSAAAMAAASGVWLCGGSIAQSFDAAAMTLKAVLGLVCDPVAGLVEAPCIKRNAFGAVQALLAIDMAMAGIQSVLPFEEVVGAMKEVGERMPADFKETSCGGCAACKTAKMWEEKLYTEV